MKPPKDKILKKMKTGIWRLHTDGETVQLKLNLQR